MPFFRVCLRKEREKDLDNPFKSRCLLPKVDQRTWEFVWAADEAEIHALFAKAKAANEEGVLGMEIHSIARHSTDEVIKHCEGR